MKIALVCISKNEDNYIQEWIDYNLKLGFDDIFIYANNWQYSNNQDKVHVKHIDGEIQQLNAYNDFTENNNKSMAYKWAAFFDVDEFLVLNQHNNIKSFLESYSDCNAIGINWAIFGNNNLECVDGEYSVLKRFTNRSTSDFKPNSHVKTIVQFPCHSKKMVHDIEGTWFTLNKEKRTGPYNDNVDWSVAQLNHYFTKSDEEFVAKCNRGRADLNEKRQITDFNEYKNANQVYDQRAKDFLYG